MKKRVVSFIFLFIVLSSFFLISVGFVSANYDIMNPPPSNNCRSGYDCLLSSFGRACVGATFDDSGNSLISGSCQNVSCQSDDSEQSSRDYFCSQSLGTGYFCVDDFCSAKCTSTGPSSCPTGYYCSQDKCFILKLNGETCTLDNECASENCESVLTASTNNLITGRVIYPVQSNSNLGSDLLRKICKPGPKSCSVDSNCLEGQGCLNNKCQALCPYVVPRPRQTSSSTLLIVLNPDHVWACNITATGCALYNQPLLFSLSGNSASPPTLLESGSCTSNTYCSLFSNVAYCLPKKSPGITCTQSYECVFGTCTNGKCSCDSTHACPSGQTCTNGNCVTSPTGTCSLDSDCTTSRSRCNFQTRQCVVLPCTDSQDCNSGQTCNVATGTCILSPTTCTGTGQSTCSINQHCDSGTCRPNTVVDNRISCSAIVSCPTEKICDESVNFCVEVTTKTDNCGAFTSCNSEGESCTDNGGQNINCFTKALASYCGLYKLNGVNKAGCYEKLALDKSCTKNYQCQSAHCTNGKCVSGATTCTQDSTCASLDQICDGTSCVLKTCRDSNQCGRTDVLKRACYTRGGLPGFCKEVKCLGTPPVCEDQDHDGIRDDVDNLVGDPNGISCASLGGIHCNGQCLDSQSPNEVTRERGCCVPVSSTVRAGCKDERFVAELGKSLNIVRTCINPPGTAKVEIKEGNNLVSADQATLAGFSSPSYTEQDYGCGGVEVTPDPKGQPVPGYGFLGIIFSSLLVGLYYLRKRD